MNILNGMSNFLDKLQQKPYKAKIRILWITAFVVAVALLSIFIFNVKNTFTEVSGRNLFERANNGSIASVSQAFSEIERVEKTDKSLKIFLNFHNTTDDILNVSKLGDITLTDGQISVQPTEITDRQGRPFVQKILSQTQNFAILIFPAFPPDQGTLTLNNMFFERNQSSQFQQKIELNLHELNQQVKVRN